MSKATPIFASLVLFLAVVGTGCGGDGDGAGAETASTAAVSDTGPPQTKEEYIRRAEEICSKADARVYDEAVDYRKDHAKELNKLEPIPAEEKIIRVVVVPSVKRQVKEIEALGAPQGEEEKIKAIFATIDSEIGRLEKNLYSISLEDPSEYPFQRYVRLARDYGFNACRNLA